MMFSRLMTVCLMVAVFASMNPAAAGADEQIVTRSTYREVAKKVSPAVVNVKIKSNIVFGRAQGTITIPPNFGLDDETREYLERLFERQMPGLTPNDEEEYRYSRSGSGVVIRQIGRAHV